ncbi:MAG: hypothetical protein OEW67_08380 [Cyclobacteriaceae bacterium]|nr:hypothetical protein [Cyclobacteriaceae bacterium]
MKTIINKIGQREKSGLIILLYIVLLLLTSLLLEGGVDALL